MRRLVQGMRSPRIEDVRQHQLIFQRRTAGTNDGLQSLQRIRHNSTADDDLICSAHYLVFGGVQPAAAGSKRNVVAVPDAGAAMYAFLAIENGRISAILIRRDSFARAD